MKGNGLTHRVMGKNCANLCRLFSVNLLLFFASSVISTRKHHISSLYHASHVPGPRSLSSHKTQQILQILLLLSSNSSLPLFARQESDEEWAEVSLTHYTGKMILNFCYRLSLEVTPSTITFQANYSSEYFPPRWIAELLCRNVFIFIFSD